MQYVRILLSLALLTVSTVAQAQLCDATRYIDDYDIHPAKYTIGFKAPAAGERSIVWPPDPALRGTVPFGQHASGQSIAELEDELDFNGEILSLLDAMNALIACISEQEAQRWRSDPRVDYVSGPQVVYLGLSPGAQDSTRNNPQLSWSDGYTLTLPFVDAEGIPGKYQHAQIAYQPATQSWRVVGFRQVNPIDSISAVELVVTQQVPVQAFLKVSGSLGGGCAQVGEFAVRKEVELFDVYLYYQYVAPNCLGLDWSTTFRKVIPLDIYGLPAGTYRWSFNGRFNGSFTLAVDNVLP